MADPTILVTSDDENILESTVASKSKKQKQTGPSITSFLPAMCDETCVCPVCGRGFTKSSITSHVNKCLAADSSGVLPVPVERKEVTPTPHAIKVAVKAQTTTATARNADSSRSNKLKLKKSSRGECREMHSVHLCVCVAFLSLFDRGSIATFQLH